MVLVMARRKAGLYERQLKALKEELKNKSRKLRDPVKKLA
jgi:dynactin complex subunit